MEAIVTKAHHVLLAAILASAVGSPFEASAKSENVVQQLPSAAVKLPVEGKLPALTGATEWLNSPPLMADSLRGTVVLVEFWTYSCINWRRTLPYVRAWNEKYKDHGLVVIGVHAPEFGFERDVGNVRRAATELGITYPIAVDNDYAVWRAFKNQYWPALYFIDAQGRIRHHEFGEGGYQGAEPIIRQLLAEAGFRGLGDTRVSVRANGAEAPADWTSKSLTPTAIPCRIPYPLTCSSS